MANAYRKPNQSSKGLHVRLNDELVERLDKTCERHSISRAMIIERAVERHLDYLDKMMARLDQINDEPTTKETEGEHHPQ